MNNSNEKYLKKHEMLLESLYKCDRGHFLPTEIYQKLETGPAHQPYFCNFLVGCQIL